jgi:hypothetical protein
VALPPAPFTYVHVLRGAVRLDAVELRAGDAARAAGGPALTLLASGGAEYVVWSMREEPPPP